MSARHKLNSAAVHGVLIVAGLIAGLTESWRVFLLLVAALIATAVHSGDIRLGNRRP
jgi:uncharacterized protein related to proFAR isomerase